jgi:hypothetical protein
LIVHPCSTIQVVINKTNDLKPFCNVLFLWGSLFSNESPH